ncbi:hypothetical protein J3R30DRAFT_3283650, partial [Lentinula aciculospora]
NIGTDMCINPCHAFTGPWADLQNCFYCDGPRYDLSATVIFMPAKSFRSLAKHSAT